VNIITALEAQLRRNNMAEATAVGNHLWTIKYDRSSTTALILTTKRDPSLALKKALALTRDKDSDWHMGTFEDMSYSGYIDA
jgi:hypothetical protein